MWLSVFPYVYYIICPAIRQYNWIKRRKKNGSKLRSFSRSSYFLYMNLESTELDIRVIRASAKRRRFSERSDYFSIPAAKRAFRFKFSKRNADTKPMAESTDMAIKQFM